MRLLRNMTERRDSATYHRGIVDFLADDVHRDLGCEIIDLYRNGPGMEKQTQEPFKKKISLSVILPYKKNEQTLGRAALESLLQQNYPNYEIILVASGFGFEVPEGLADLLTHDRIKFFYHPASLPTARLVSKGWKEARGEQVLVVNPDQLYPDDFLRQAQSNGSTAPKLTGRIDQIPLKIVYLVLNLCLSGGTAVILQHAHRLDKLGYDVSLLDLGVQGACAWDSLSVPIYPYHTKFQSSKDHIDIAIGTHWTTVFFLQSLPAQRKIYFVQSDERRFLPDETNMNLVDFTYRMDYEFMTEAIWIQRWLQEEFGHKAYYVPNGLDGQIFHRTEPIVPKGKRPKILLEGAIDYWYKGMEEAYAAVSNLEADIWIVSSHGAPKKGWRYEAFFQRAPMNEMKRIYSSCDILLKMSLVEGFFGPPLEAMACGCAVVVGKVTGYDEYIKDGYNALVVEKGDIAGAQEAVQKLVEDDELRARLIQNGLKTAEDWSWERSIKHLEEAVRQNPVKIYYRDTFPERYDYETELPLIKECFQNYLECQTQTEKIQGFMNVLRYDLAQLFRGKATSESWLDYARFVLRTGIERLFELKRVIWPSGKTL